METQKLDLMAEISNLKLKLTAVEKDRLDYEDRFRDTEVSDTLSLSLSPSTYTYTYMGVYTYALPTYS